MKARSVNSFLIPVLLAALNLLMAGRVTAQTFTTLHSFTSHSDGRTPLGGLVLSGNTLYGTASSGGNESAGTVFAVNTDGAGFTNLYNFTARSFDSPYTNSDGSNPNGGLIVSGNTLYGTAGQGGTSGNGTVFAVYTNGTSFTNLHSFTATSGSFSTNSDGSEPEAGLILSGKTLYGTTIIGGTLGEGTVFAVNTNGTSFTNLHSFTDTSSYQPFAGLILSGNTLYGTAHSGGDSGKGTVFAVNTNGTGFTNLYSFTAIANNGNGYYTNSGGAYPQAGLILSGNTLYGTASQGGSGGEGTVFAVKTDGTGFTNLHSFTAVLNSTNSDGAHTAAGLILSGNTLYGTAGQGGSSGNGTVFAVNTDGTGFANLHSFTAVLNSTNSDGSGPSAGLILSGNSLYGTAADGGSSGNGTIFSINLALNIKTNGLAASPLSGGMAQLTYLGTPGAKFALDWAHGLNTPIIWTPLATNTTTPDGYLIFTNTASGTNDFYRIRSVP